MHGAYVSNVICQSTRATTISGRHYVRHCVPLVCVCDELSADGDCLGNAGRTATFKWTHDGVPLLLFVDVPSVFPTDPPRLTVQVSSPLRLRLRLLLRLRRVHYPLN